MLAALARAGYQHVPRSVAASDWEEDCTPARLEDEVVAEMLGQDDGAVVLLHGWPAATALAMPAIIRRLRSSGARFVNIDAIVDREEPRNAAVA